MFDEDQSRTQPKHISETIREMTDGGRDIVRFFVDAVLGKMEGAKPCHRLDATVQLLDYRYHKDLAEFVREKTDDGRLIVRFLLDVIQLKIDDVSERDRVQARQLLNRIFNGKTWIPLPCPPEE